ncbi:MAG: MFS transporter, partial [Chloroflexota bacterium]|nr:MFS transporter [Chloroflexota bacterium]
VYEGARSIVGPYLLTLGASAALVGLVSGVGEFIGYGLRVVAGYAADRTRAYWVMTIGGYALNVLAVPLLALVGRVELAIALLMAERLGKAIRVPSRDTLISYASRPIGRGLAFGLHEALDQVGAVVGPLGLAAVLAARPGDYRTAFLLLAVPAGLTILALVSARLRFPDPHAFERAARDQAAADAAPPRPINRLFWRYATFTVLAVAGFAPFPLIAYHLTVREVLAPAQVPVLFALAMAVDAGVALLTGRIYDRRGLAVLVAVPLVTAASVAVFTTQPAIVWLGGVAWGAVMGIQESTLRAAVADLVSLERRATGYGLFNATYGLALLGGGAVMGLLYERGPAWVVAFIVVTEAVALIAFVGFLRRAERVR